MDPKNMTREEWEAELSQHTRIEEAEKALSRLKLELGVRHDNEHVGSGLGGNSSELFFLLTHRVKFEASADDLVHFVNGKNNSEIVLQAPDKAAIKQIRKAFTEFYNSHPDKKEVTQQQLMNPSYLRDLNSTSVDVRILIHALEETLILQSWLDAKAAFRTQIRDFFAGETKELRIKFLKELNLPADYYSTLSKEKHYQEDPLSDMFRDHPVWGVRNAAVNKRLSEVEERLISNEDNERLKLVGACPDYIALFVMRTVISIERMVSLNLDELESCSFLGKINKDLDRASKEESE
jgi:hypothetical protein